MGDDFFDDVGEVDFAKKTDLSCLDGLNRLRQLRISTATDADLAPVGRLTGLKSLDLSNTEVTDAGVAKLKTLAALEDLDLRWTHVTDGALVQLDSLRNLKGLFLLKAHITKQGLLRFYRFHPKCYVAISWPPGRLYKVEDLKDYPDSSLYIPSK